METRATVMENGLRPAMDRLAQLPDVRRLSRALAFVSGFSFQVVVCHSPKVAVALQRSLADAVSLERQTRVDIERLSPYPLDLYEAGPPSLDADDLVQRILPRLVVASAPDRLVFIDAARARASEAEAWRTLMLRLAVH